MPTLITVSRYNTAHEVLLWIDGIFRISGKFISVFQFFVNDLFKATRYRHKNVIRASVLIYFKHSRWIFDAPDDPRLRRTELS